MKVKTIILTMVVLPGFALADCNLQTGGYQMGSSFYGPTVCTGTVGTISVQGPLTLTNAALSNVSVNGPVTATNSSVKDLSLNGVLKASDSHFGNINGSANIYFTGSEASNISISGSPTLGGSYIVYLDQSSKVVNLSGAKIENQ